MDYVPPDFVRSDAWILLALVLNHAKGGATLPEIIAVANFINHAIPTRDELEGALNRLLAANYIAVHGKRFDVTQPVMAAYDRVAKRKQSVPHRLDALQRFLASTPRLELCPKAIVITEPAMENARQGYQQQLQDIQKRISEPRGTA